MLKSINGHYLFGLFRIVFLNICCPFLVMVFLNNNFVFSHRPKLNTDRAKNSYFNRLVYKYDLAF